MAEVAIPFSDPIFKRKLLHWAAQQPYCVMLDSCATQVDQYGRYDFLIGIALKHHPARIQDLDTLEAALADGPPAWRFGYFSYALKAAIEPRLQDDLQAVVPFPQMEFFVPDLVISKLRDAASIVFEQGYSDEVLAAIEAQVLVPNIVHDFSGFISNFSQAQYCATIEQLRKHIREGDFYEINLSQNFVATVRLERPAALWEELIAASPVPFAAFGKWGERYLLCASPERFLQKQADRLLTQPIKGTARRGKTPDEDASLAQALRDSEKERAENVMIVDLSRNDLHRSCEVGSVTVPHLFEVQQFPQVHHLVSTIVGQKRADVSVAQVIRHTFPPGSMTGAPKVRTCERIAEYEPQARGIYAGAIGYFAPNGDFDFNVVIRSLVYDAQTAALSYHVGGAITWDSDPQAEYEETLLKAQAISRLFQGK